MPLPDYAQSLLAFHRAHEGTLRDVVGSLPINPGDRLVDVATGDGTYALLMAALGAEIFAVDINPDFLSWVAERAREQACDVKEMQGNALALPLETDSMDGAFCAQSFYSIDDVDGIMDEMIRVVKPDGWVGVMENDSLHHVILPWPAKLEIEILKAEYQALNLEENNAKRFYLGRRLSQVMKEAGLRRLTQRSFATQYSVPLSSDAREFLARHLQTLMDRAEAHLDAEPLKSAKRLSDPLSREYLLDSEEFSATVIDFVVWGQVPGPERG